MVRGLMNSRQGVMRHKGVKFCRNNIWWGTALCRALAKGAWAKHF